MKHTKWGAGAVFAVLLAGLLSPAPKQGLMGPQTAQAQNLGQRVVAGVVEDASAAPVANATIFLKELKSKSIRSYTSTANGRFRFVQVNMTEDYELWAEKDGRKSAVKTVSSWDTRKQFVVELKLK